MGRQCRYSTCKGTALFGTEYKNPVFCGIHKEANMFNVRIKKCLDCDKPALFGADASELLYC